MEDDDPEKRIRELERGLSDATWHPQSPPPTSDSPYLGDTGYMGGSPYGFGVPPPRRRGINWSLVLVLGFAILVPVVILVASISPSALRSAPRMPAPSSGPTAVPQGGELRVGGNSETKTIACNDGNLTFYGYGSKYSVTGHCASLTVGGYNNNVTVDSADTLESTGYGNTVTDRACNNGKLKLSAYGNAFNVTGHCASLTVSSYDNKVTVDSVDSINVSGYNNVVIYHSGAPKTTDSGYSNTIRQG